MEPKVLSQLQGLLSAFLDGLNFAIAMEDKHSDILEEAKTKLFEAQLLLNRLPVSKIGE